MLFDNLQNQLLPSRVAFPWRVLSGCFQQHLLGICLSRERCSGWDYNSRGHHRKWGVRVNAPSLKFQDFKEAHVDACAFEVSQMSHCLEDFFFLNWKIQIPLFTFEVPNYFLAGCDEDEKLQPKVPCLGNQMCGPGRVGTAARRDYSGKGNSLPQMLLSLSPYLRALSDANRLE